MAFSTRIRHKLDGRVRLQFAMKDFEQVRSHQAMLQLRQTPGIIRVLPNMLTHSILVEAYSQERLDQGLQTLVAQDLIEWDASAEVKPKAQSKPLAEHWKNFQKDADAVIKTSTDGALDAKTGVALLLAGLGLSQMFAGNILPAGMTLIMYALGTMEESTSYQTGQ